MDIVLLDGGMGQELVRRSNNPAHPQWSAYVMMQEPDIVQAVHEDYLRAGASVITLNTYSTTPGRFEKFGMPERFEEVQQIGIDIAHRARDAVGADASIAGCLSPLVGSYHPELLPEDAILLAEYRRIAAIEADHVDLFICETMSKASEGRMAALAASETGKPVWVAYSLAETLADDGTPRLRSGETVAEAMAAIADLDVAAVLFNCCPPEVVTPGLAGLAVTGKPFGAYANGFQPIPRGFTLGTTVDMLSARDDLDPEQYALRTMGWVGMGASIVGGCCEVGPAHITEIARRLAEAGHNITTT